MVKEKASETEEIIRRFQESRYSEEMESKIQKWLIDEEDSEEKEKASLSYWNSLDVKADKPTYKAFKRVSKRIGDNQTGEVIPLLYYLKRIAAIVIPLFIISVFGYYIYQNTREIYVSTINGEVKQIELPDGSQVWINSESSVRYSSSFTKNTRSVSLQGEAYFLVKRDESKPFIVNTEKLLVEVLGTEFNVKAYDGDNKITTTLNTGKVGIRTNADKSFVLNPGEQLIYDNRTKETSLVRVSADDFSGWTKGQLYFINASFSEILKTLEKQFDVSFILKDPIVSSERTYTVKFIKDDSLQQILDVLKDVTGIFSYHIEGDKVYIEFTE